MPPRRPRRAAKDQESAATAATGRRRPGRFRRWVLRPAFWTLALLALLILIGQLILDSRWVRERGREILADELSAYLNRPVTIDEVSFELLPLSVEVHGFTIAGPDAADPPFLHIPWVAADADLDALQRRKIHLKQVRVERPVIYLHFFPDGSNNYPKAHRKKKKRRPRPFEVLVDRLEVDGAELALDQDRIRLSFASDEIRARFFGLGDLEVGGQVVAQNVAVRLPNAQPLAVAVAVEARVGSRRLEVLSSRISGPGVAVRADGTCEWTPGDRLDRKCLFQANGRGSGRLLSDLGYFNDFRGDIDFQGSFAWRPGTSGWRSRISADHFDLWQRPMTGLEGSLVADRYGTRGVLDRVRYAGGELRGDITYEHRETGRPLSFDLDFDGLRLDDLLADQQIPSTGYASRASGRFVYRFPFGEAERGDGRADVEITADPSLPGLPLAGTFPIHFDIAGGVVNTESISLQSDRQSVLASGWYDLDRRTGAYDYGIASADLPELAPLLPLEATEEPPLWLPTAGRGELAGTLYLAPGEATADLRLALEEVESPSGNFRRAGGNLHLAAEAVDPLRLELGDGEEALVIRGRMPYVPSDEDSTLLVFDGFNWPLAAARRWLDFDLPVDGRISGRLHLHVGSEASDGRLTGTVTPATLELKISPPTPQRSVVTGAEKISPPAPQGAEQLAEPLRLELESLAGRLAWDRDRITFHRLEMVAESGTLRGEGIYDWTTGEIDLALSSPALEIGAAPLQAYLPRGDLRGEVSIAARLRGPLDRPRIEIDLGADGIALGGRVLAGRPSRLELDSEDGRWSADGRLLDMVTLSGGGALDRRRTELAFDLEGNNLSGLLELLFEEPPADVGGTFRGTLALADPGRGEVPAATLTLDRLRLEMRQRILENREPVTLELTPERIAISSFHVVEEATGSEFLLTGTTGWGAEEPVDLRLRSSLDTGWLEFFDLGFDLAGTLDLSAAVGGTLERPTLDGQGELRGGRLDLGQQLPYDLEDLHGGLAFRPGRITFDRLEGRLAGGRVVLAGEFEEGDEVEDAVRYRLQASGEELHLLYPEGWSVRGSTELTLRSIDGGHRVDGRADLDQLEYRQDVRFDFAQLARDFLRRQRLEIDPADSLLSTVELDVDVVAPGTLRVRNNLAHLDGSAELALRGDLAAPVIYGEVEVEPGGTVVYNNTDYEVERGHLDFANPYRFDPEVDLVLTTRVRDFDITLALAGSFERLETRFSSEPPLPDLEVFRILATGDTSPQTTVLEPRRADSRLADRRESESTSAATFLYGQAAAVVGERFNTLFGLDKFRIDPLTGSGDNLSKARVTVGKRLSKDFFLTYSADPSSTEEQRLQIEWQVTPGLVVVLSQNGDNTYSADARWESSF